MKNFELKLNNESWICTDPDNHQYCKQVSEDKFEFLQVCDLSEYVEDESKNFCIYSMTIDLNVYDIRSELFFKRYIASFYIQAQWREYLKDVKLHQLLAECIFELEMETGSEFVGSYKDIVDKAESLLAS